MSKITGRTFMAIVLDQKHLAESFASDYEKDMARGDLGAVSDYRHNATCAAICGFLYKTAKTKKLDKMSWEHHLESTFKNKGDVKQIERESIQDALEFLAIEIVRDPTIQIENMMPETIKYLLLRTTETQVDAFRSIARYGQEGEPMALLLEMRAREGQSLLRSFINECLK